MKKRIIILLLALVCLCSFSCCSIAERSGSEMSVYSNGDYHFEFTHPSSFSLKETIENEEDDDECDFIFKDSEDRQITISCKFNQYDDLYEYVKGNSFNTKKITSLTPASFIYDMRDDKKPMYMIVAATKRMVVTTSIELDAQDTQGLELCDKLSFVFTEYANVPRENRFLSDDITLYQKHLSLNIPANAEYTLYPEPAQIPDGVENVEEFDANAACDAIDILATHYAASYKINVRSSSPYANDGLTSHGANSVQPEYISELTNGAVSGAVFRDGSLMDGELGAYIYAPFVCEYNGEQCYGAYISGFYGELYYEYAYACANSAPDGEREQFEDLLASLKLK